MDAGTTDAIVYFGFAALGAGGVCIVLWALLFDRPHTRAARTLRPLSPFTPRESPPLMSDTARTTTINDYPVLANPHVSLSGPVDHEMYGLFRDQLANAPTDGPTVIAISTLGGDPEVARLMGDEIRLLREFQGREFLFLGKVAVYSAGATFMAAFPVDKRFLTKGTRIMIHERIMNKSIELAGPLKTCIANLKANLHEIEHSILIEEEGFRAIVEGSKVAFDDLVHRAPENWYIDAEEARDLELVLDVV